MAEDTPNACTLAPGSTRRRPDEFRALYATALRDVRRPEQRHLQLVLAGGEDSPC